MYATCSYTILTGERKARSLVYPYRQLKGGKPTATIAAALPLLDRNRIAFLDKVAICTYVSEGFEVDLEVSNFTLLSRVPTRVLT